MLKVFGTFSSVANFWSCFGNYDTFGHFHRNKGPHIGKKWDNFYFVLSFQQTLNIRYKLAMSSFELGSSGIAFVNLLKPKLELFSVTSMLAKLTVINGLSKNLKNKIGKDSSKLGPLHKKLLILFFKIFDDQQLLKHSVKILQYVMYIVNDNHCPKMGY